MHLAPIETWYAQHRGSLIAFAYLVARNREDAEDAVQSAMAATMPRWELIAEAKRAAYIKRAIVNHLASEGRRQPRSGLVSLEALPTEPQHRATPDQTTRVELADAAWRLCATLPVNQRAALVMRFYEDASYEQIAHGLGCSVVTARSHVHRALLRLQRTHQTSPPEGNLA